MPRSRIRQERKLFVCPTENLLSTITTPRKEHGKHLRETLQISRSYGQIAEICKGLVRRSQLAFTCCCRLAPSGHALIEARQRDEGLSGRNCRLVGYTDISTRFHVTSGLPVNRLQRSLQSDSFQHIELRKAISQEFCASDWLFSQSFAQRQRSGADPDRLPWLTGLLISG